LEAERSACSPSSLALALAWIDATEHLIIDGLAFELPAKKACLCRTVGSDLFSTLFHLDLPPAINGPDQRGREKKEGEKRRKKVKKSPASTYR
jgi:hypothetical protein